ncbi:MAG: LacI family DNA-binding transcriptional regulator [Tetrasphaera sp.]
MTINDVAAAAGVSRSTVSLVLNKRGRVSDHTRRRVRAAMVDLDYVYDRRAANLRHQAAHTIGMVATDIRNSYFAEFSMAVETVLDEHGLTLFQGYSRDDVTRQQTLLQQMLEHRVAGLLILPAAGTTDDDLEAVRGSVQVPHVLISRSVAGHACDSVTIDNRRAGAMATHHLLDHGCSTIAFLGGVRGSSSREDRERGYREALRANKIQVRKELIIPAANTSDGGRDATATLLERISTSDCDQVDGIVCYSDFLARGVMSALAEAGLRVGRDIRLISHDDSSDALTVYPQLSSVSTHASETGRAAATLLVQRVAEPARPIQRIELAPVLVVRASSAPDTHKTRMPPHPLVDRSTTGDSAESYRETKEGQP